MQPKKRAKTLIKTRKWQKSEIIWEEASQEVKVKNRNRNIMKLFRKICVGPST